MRKVMPIEVVNISCTRLESISIADRNEEFTINPLKYRFLIKSTAIFVHESWTIMNLLPAKNLCAEPLFATEGYTRYRLGFYIVCWWTVCWCVDIDRNDLIDGVFGSRSSDSGGPLISDFHGMFWLVSSHGVMDTWIS